MRVSLLVNPRSGGVDDPDLGGLPAEIDGVDHGFEGTLVAVGG